MLEFLRLFARLLASPLRTQAQREAEIIVLRHQLNVLRRQAPTPRLTAAADPAAASFGSAVCFLRLGALSPSFNRKRSCAIGDGSRGLATRRQAKGQEIEVRSLIHRMSLENPLWGAPRHSRRTAQARDRRRSIHRRQVHGQRQLPPRMFWTADREESGNCETAAVLNRAIRRGRGAWLVRTRHAMQALY